MLTTIFMPFTICNISLCDENSLQTSTKSTSCIKLMTSSDDSVNDTSAEHTSPAIWSSFLTISFGELLMPLPKNGLDLVHHDL